MFAAFVPGILELMIIACILGIPLLAVVVILAVNRQSRANYTQNPNLRPCPDCGRYVSVRASTCPGCGAPLQVN